MSGPRILRVNFFVDEESFTDEWLGGLTMETVLIANCPGGFIGTSFQSAVVNSVAGMNDYLNNNHPSWQVCSGALYTNSKSSVYYTSNRYLPNLTDGRFVRGDTTVGGTGGSTNHTMSNNTMPSHNHGHNINDSDNNHGHSGYNNSNEVHDHSDRWWNVGGNWLTINRRNANVTTTTNYSLGSNETGSMKHTHDVNSTNTNHGHNINTSVGNTGGNSAFSILPAYTNYFYTTRVF